MTPIGEPREREIGKNTKRGIVICLFSSIFGIMIVSGSTKPESFYVGTVLLGISISVMIIYLFWWIACKADDFIGRQNEQR